MYSWVLHYLDYRASGGWWAYLWAPHDVHRPVWIRLLTAFDIEAFGGVSYPFIIPTTICHLVTAWLLSGGGAVAAYPVALVRPLGYVVLMFVMTSVAAVDCAIPIPGGSDVLVPVRYSVLLTPLHAGLLWIATPVLSRLWSSERRQRAPAAGLVGVSVLLLVAQVAAGQAAAANTSRMRAAIDRFVAGESDPEMTTVIDSDLGQARRELEIMQRAGVHLQAR